MMLSLFIVCSIGSQVHYNSSNENIPTPVDGHILAESSIFTYIGGWNHDTVDCIVVDNEGNSYIAGRTLSNNIPQPPEGPAISYSGLSDYYVMKISSAGELVYTSYIGASGIDGSLSMSAGTACAIDVDDLGRVYMTGSTDSYYFPMVNAWDSNYHGFGDGFVLRLDPSGTAFQYSTFIGGNGVDEPTAIKVDDSYNVYIAGFTRSSDFLTQYAYDSTLGGNSDLFLLKLNQNGQLIFSTYVGGSGSEVTYGDSLAVDEGGNAYIVGNTWSSDLPVSNPAFPFKDPYNDLYFWKFNSNGGFEAGLYYGSGSSDHIGGIAVDHLGYIYLCGSGSEIPLDYTIYPYTSWRISMYIAKFSPNTDLLHATGIGGASSTHPYDLTVDDRCSIYVTGRTQASNFPMEDPLDNSYGGEGDCFITKLSNEGDQILFSSFIGGSGEEIGLTMTPTQYGTILVGGVTNSSDLSVVNPLVSEHHNYDGFLIEFDDAWEDTPLLITLPTSTTTTTTITIPTPTTTTTTTTTTSTSQPDPYSPVGIFSDLHIDDVLRVGLVVEIIILFSFVGFIKHRQRQ
jgi:hypothetical protein